MRYNKITNLLDKLDKDEIPKFTTIKWIEIFDQSNGTYNPNKDIRFKTPQVRSDLCDFNEAYIVVIGTITATKPGNNLNNYNKKVALKNSALFFNCILKINNQLIEDAQDLDVVTPIYNIYFIILKTLEKQLDHFEIIMQIFQIQDIITMIGTEYFIKLETQIVLTIKLDWLVVLVITCLLFLPQLKLKI